MLTLVIVRLIEQVIAFNRARNDIDKPESIEDRAPVFPPDEL